MIFGNNLIKVVCENKFHIEFNATDALKRVQLNPENLVQVSYATDWLKSRAEKHKDNEEVVLEMYRPFDWTYSTDYKGTLRKGDFIRDDSKAIPLDKLKRQDPILFFDDMILYEDELGDNGISILNVKIRAMRSCMLILQRLFVRVDNVLLRINDTRLFIDFEENLVIRECKKQESKYEDILRLCHGNDPRRLLRDMNWCAGKLPVLSVEREYIQY
ncbi:unnamed protein product [Ambrosiozyma monospora]|uniref:Unnamed protein product n=1 Tax=Ambrosiozyma monospora TaxID=43982 RepID=A0ACB5T594_AMBMO|nr:unnamed protein product [Ambrosiozyma monospora]